MSTREISAGATQPTSRASQRALNTTPVFQTWCSASHELAPSRIPPAVKVLPSVARVRSQEDRALITDGAFDPAIKAIASTFICVGIAVLLARVTFFVF